MKNIIIILIVGIITVMLGVFLFIKGIMLGRVLMTLGFLIELYSIIVIFRSYKIIKKN
jgi:hypothetical protein